MAENDQAFDAIDAAEPGAQSLDRGVVDGTLPGERGHGGGNETSEIERFHVMSSCWGWGLSAEPLHATSCMSEPV
jgi:hypothetical protein